MYFGAYLGNDVHLGGWCDVMRRHAAWLGLCCSVESRHLDDGRVFGFGWLTRDALGHAGRRVEADGLLALSTSDVMRRPTGAGMTEQMWRDLIERVGSQAVHVGISLHTGEMSAAVPILSRERFYHCCDARGWVFGNDTRLMLRWAGLKLDERAVYAFFQYGGVPPPLTVSKNVQCVAPGHILRVGPGSHERSVSPLVDPCAEAGGAVERADAETRVCDTLDGILSRVPESTVLYFSGGTDSGLFAARLAEMGRRDVRLVNLSFGPHDQEGHLAWRMARHLNMPFEQVTFRFRDIPEVLARLGKDHSFLFNDYTLIPANLLVHASLASLSPSRTALEGSGSYAGFAGTVRRYRTFKRVHAVPFWMRRTLGSAYRWLWRYDGTIERMGRVLRRSVQMPPEHAAVIGRSSLDGIAYTIPPEIRDGLEETVRASVERLHEHLGPVEYVILLELLHASTGVFSCKFSHPLAAQGVRMTCPFLEPAFLRVILSGQARESVGREGARLVKRILARSVPREWAYRPKSAFLPPFREMFAHSAIQEFLRGVALSRNNLLADYVEINIATAMAERAARGKPLNIGVYNFLWGLIFASAWLQQQEDHPLGQC